MGNWFSSFDANDLSRECESSIVAATVVAPWLFAATTAVSTAGSMRAGSGSPPDYPPARPPGSSAPVVAR